MGSSKAEGFPGESGTFKKTTESGSEFRSHGSSDQLRSEGKDSISGNIYGASVTGAINPDRYNLGKNSGKSEAERYPSGEKIWDTAKNQTEVRGTKLKEDISTNPNREDNPSGKNKKK